MPPSTIPSIFNAISSPDPRCENSEPMLPRNGKALSQVLALGAHLLRCRDKAVPRYCCPATIFRDPGTDTDIISVQHFWTGGLETAGPGCYDAVAIARAAGFRMLVMSRIRHATIVLNRSEPAKNSGQNIPKNRCRTTIARNCPLSGIRCAGTSNASAIGRIEPNGKYTGQFTACPLSIAIASDAAE